MYEWENQMSNTAKYFVFMLVYGIWTININLIKPTVFNVLSYTMLTIVMLIMLYKWCKEF